MEEIIKRLNKNKPNLVHSTFSKLLTLMLDKKKKGVKFTRQSEEIVLLKDQCLSHNLATSQGACNTLQACIKYSLMSAQDVLTLLISLSVQNKNIPQILFTVMLIQKSEHCEGGHPSGSPILLILKHCETAWKPLLDMIHVSSSSDLWKPGSINFYLPLFNYILCTRNTQLPLAAKQSTWQLLAKLTSRGPRVRILLEHFVRYQSTTSNDLTETIAFLSDIYEDVVDANASFASLLLLYAAHFLLRALENNMDTGVLWKIIQNLTTKTLSYRLSPWSNADIRKLTMSEVVPSTILMLVQCIPHCDEINLKCLLSTSQTLVRYFSIDPSIYCSYLMPLLPWLSSSFTSPHVLSNTGMDVINNADLNSDVHEFIMMIVNSLNTSEDVGTKDSRGSVRDIEQSKEISSTEDPDDRSDSLSCDLDDFELEVDERCPWETGDEPVKRTDEIGNFMMGEEKTWGLKYKEIRAEQTRVYLELHILSAPSTLSPYTIQSKKLKPEHDSIIQLVEWKEVKQMMFSTMERVMVAQSLSQKLNVKPIEDWDGEFGEFAASTYLVSGFLCSGLLLPQHDYARTNHPLLNPSYKTALEFLIKQDSSSAIYLILYLLAREVRAIGIKYWLEKLIITARDKDNVPLILNTLDSLRRARDPALTSFLISLYTQLFQIEPRTFPFLLPLLTQNRAGIEAWVFDTLRAYSVSHVQKIKPEIYGKELVPLLSSILSSYTEPHSRCTPACLALGAIRELCLTGVVDFASIWRSLGVLRYDRRPRFLVSFIELMECVVSDDDSRAGNQIPSELEYDISSLLWSYVAENIGKEVTHAALCALARFNFQSDYPLKYLDHSFRLGLKIPKSVLGKLQQNSCNIEEHVMFIPGECFLNILNKMDCGSYQPTSECCLHRYKLKGEPIFKPFGWSKQRVKPEDYSIDSGVCLKHRCPLGVKENKLTEGQEILNEKKEKCESCQRISNRRDDGTCYEGFIKLMQACIERELKSYREIIYNSPYQDSNSKEPADYSYLPYKSVLRSLVKYLQNTVTNSDQKYSPQVHIVLQLLSSTYSKPLPPLDWSFLFRAYFPSEHLAASVSSDLKSSGPRFEWKAKKGDADYCRISVLYIAASSCGNSAETRRNLALCLRQSVDMIPQVVTNAVVIKYMPVLCEHLDSEVFERYVRLNAKTCTEAFLLNNYSSYNKESEEKESQEWNVEDIKRTLEEECTVEHCLRPYTMVHFFNGIKRCFEKFCSGITGLNLPPKTTLDVNLLHLVSGVREMFTSFDYTLSYELFSQILSCISTMSAPFHQYLMSSLKADETIYANQLTLLNTHLIEIKQLPLSLQSLLQYRDIKSCDENIIYSIFYYQIPSLLKDYSRHEVLDLIIQELLPYIIQKQGAHSSELMRIVFLCIYCKCAHMQLLPKSLENIVTEMEYCRQEALNTAHRARIPVEEKDKREVDVFGSMATLFPVAFLSILKAEQYTQVTSLFDALITRKYLTKNYATIINQILIALRN